MVDVVAALTEEYEYYKLATKHASRFDEVTSFRYINQHVRVEDAYRRMALLQGQLAKIKWGHTERRSEQTQVTNLCLKGILHHLERTSFANDMEKIVESVPSTTGAAPGAAKTTTAAAAPAALGADQKS